MLHPHLTGTWTGTTEAEDVVEMCVWTRLRFQQPVILVGVSGFAHSVRPTPLHAYPPRCILRGAAVCKGRRGGLQGPILHWLRWDRVLFWWVLCEELLLPWEPPDLGSPPAQALHHGGPRWVHLYGSAAGAYAECVPPLQVCAGVWCLPRRSDRGPQRGSEQV